ncbi:4-aminobutyrate aminotransferase [Paucilactobacillus hokkaidonensis JCM 18461]|uniref:4-aminobutyrate aminotransferase n=2 Tax=Paucilactobacillus hokkaidonensis TaxID=1193095 RepID=A0A0A1GWW4_9LACO|nr:aspartate aminotransferase family protein [Paucilactobacillus hokkaidonensis]KRO10091.1 acetylornithine transaminase [Paucilactobacillus hokkaidonensis]BAP85398.1 4-aminobutyrate aminotransferase [Paucilactobacillus hokkaidonensis JCM 18461]
MDLKTNKAHAMIAEENRHYAKSARINYFDLVIDHAHGAELVDVDGNKYIDLLASASAINVGHTHEKVVQAIQDQAAKLIHYTPAYFHHEPGQQLAKKLAEIAPGDSEKMVTFGNSGSDANDAIIKFARAYTGRSYVVSYMNSYHGSTYGSQTLSGCSLNMTRKIGPMLPNVVHVPFPDAYRTYPNETLHDVSVRYFDEFKRPFETYLPADETAVVLIEPIQGDGGIVKAPDEYLHWVYDFCQEHGILFAVDEVNQGLGRTGKMWSIDNFGIEPDLMSVGKSLASGMPLSAVIGKKEVMESLDAPAHLFTTSGNPVCCAASLATLQVIEDEHLVEKSATDGAYAKQAFKKMQERYAFIGDVRMYGLNGGIEIVMDKQSKTPDADAATKIIYRAFQKGLVIITLQGNILRFQPPLVITRDQLNEALQKLDDIFAELDQGLIELPDDLGNVGW